MKKEDIKREKYLYDPFDKNKINTLRNYDEFWNIEDDKVISYIILAYDINSDIIREFPIRAQQKFEAALLAGFKLNYSNQFDTNVENMIIGDNYDVDKAIVKFVSLFGKPEWTALQAYYIQLDNELLLIRKGQAEKKNTDNVDLLYKRINEISKILFGGEETVTARKALYDFIVKPERIMPRPENISKMQEDAVSPLEFQKAIECEPYEENYNPTTQKEYLRYKGHK